MLELSSHPLNKSAIGRYKAKQTPVLCLPHALSSSVSTAKKQQGVQVRAERAAEESIAVEGWGTWFLKPNVNTGFSCCPPPTPLWIQTYTHTHSWRWPLRVQLGLDRVTDMALLPDGSCRTLGFPPHSVGLTLLTFWFFLSLFKQTPGRGCDQIKAKAGLTVRERAGL